MFRTHHKTDTVVQAAKIHKVGALIRIARSILGGAIVVEYRRPEDLYRIDPAQTAAPIELATGPVPTGGSRP